MKPLVTSASIFAAYAHTGQTRKYTGEPYFQHVEAVAKMVMMTRNATPEMIAAAYLHDVVEDTGTTYADVLNKYGDPVADYVWRLTATVWPGPFEARPNRAFRMAHERRRLADSPAEVQTIKLADIIDNTATIVQYDPSFAPLYLREKLELLAVMTKGDADLYERAFAQITGEMKKCQK